MKTKPMYYKLVDREAVPATSKEWAEMIDNFDRRSVAASKIGDSDVSTVFLGLDHSFGEGRPLLFKTMVFGGKFDGLQQRCTTWDEAEAMHASVCKRVAAAQ